jgi:tetratricopeptide (TPR) repeat protein
LKSELDIKNIPKKVTEKEVHYSQELVENLCKKITEDGTEREWQREFEELRKSYMTEKYDTKALDIAEAMKQLLVEFEGVAASVSQIIIEEIELPLEQKTIKPIDPTSKLCLYHNSGIIFKLTNDPILVSTYGSVEGSWKAASQMIKGAQSFVNVMGTKMQLSFKDTNVLYSFPFVVLLDYLGYRVIASARLPINPDTLVYGTYSQGNRFNSTNSIFFDTIQLTAQYFNLKGHDLELESKEKVSVHTPVNMSVYIMDQRLYIVDSPGIMPPNGVINGKLDRSNQYHRFRPEFMKNYSKPLLSDPFTNFHPDQSHTEIIEASHYLKTKCVPNAAYILSNNYDLASLDFIPVENVLHVCGVNLRFMGLVRQQVKIPRLRMLLLSHMIARFLNKYLGEILRSNGKNFKAVILKLNHIFGKDKDSEVFWRETLSPGLSQKFEGALSSEEIQPKYDLKNHLCLPMILRLLRIVSFPSSVYRDLFTDGYVQFNVDIDVPSKRSSISNQQVEPIGFISEQIHFVMEAKGTMYYPFFEWGRTFIDVVETFNRGIFNNNDPEDAVENSSKEAEYQSNVFRQLCFVTAAFMVAVQLNPTDSGIFHMWGYGLLSFIRLKLPLLFPEYNTNQLRIELSMVAAEKFAYALLLEPKDTNARTNLADMAIKIAQLMIKESTPIQLVMNMSFYGLYHLSIVRKEQASHTESSSLLQSLPLLFQLIAQKVETTGDSEGVLNVLEESIALLREGNLERMESFALGKLNIGMEDVLWFRELRVSRRKDNYFIPDVEFFEEKPLLYCWMCHWFGTIYLEDEPNHSKFIRLDTDRNFSVPVIFEHNTFNLIETIQDNAIVSTIHSVNANNTAFVDEMIPLLKTIQAPLSRLGNAYYINYKNSKRTPQDALVLEKIILLFEQDPTATSSSLHMMALLHHQLADLPTTTSALKVQYLHKAITYYEKCFSMVIDLPSSTEIMTIKEEILRDWGTAYAQKEFIGMELGWTQQELEELRLEKMDKYKKALEIYPEPKVITNLIKIAEREASKLQTQAESLKASQDYRGAIQIWQEIDRHYDTTYSLISKNKKELYELGNVLENFMAKRLSVKSRLLEGYLNSTKFDSELYLNKFDEEVKRYREIIRIIANSYRPLAYISLSTLYELLAHRAPPEDYLITEYNLANAAALATASILCLNDSKRLTGIKKQRLAFFHAACAVAMKQDAKGGSFYRFRTIMEKVGNIVANWNKRIWMITTTQIEYHSIKQWNTSGPSKSLKGKIALWSITQLGPVNTEDRAGFLGFRIHTPGRIYKITSTHDNKAEVELFRSAIDLSIKWFKLLAYTCEHLVTPPEGIPEDIWTELVIAVKQNYYMEPILDE